MTIQEICLRANKGKIAGSNLDLPREVVHRCIPKFLGDIDRTGGLVWWRRNSVVLEIQANKNTVPLPIDFSWAEKVKVGSTNAAVNGNELLYIGDDSDLILSARMAIDMGGGTGSLSTTIPRGYWVEPDPTNGSPLLAIAFKPTTPLKVGVLYMRTVPARPDGQLTYPDPNQPVADNNDLTPYIPLEFQFALVHLLRMAILLESTDAGDTRFAAEQKQYDDVITRARTRREAGSSYKAVRMH